MDPERLKKAYGDRLCFWGSVDEQHILPFGTPEDVRKVWLLLCVGRFLADIAASQVSAEGIVFTICRQDHPETRCHNRHANFIRVREAQAGIRPIHLF